MLESLIFLGSYVSVRDIIAIAGGRAPSSPELRTDNDRECVLSEEFIDRPKFLLLTPT